MLGGHPFHIKSKKSYLNKKAYVSQKAQIFLIFFNHDFVNPNYVTNNSKAPLINALLRLKPPCYVPIACHYILANCDASPHILVLIAWTLHAMMHIMFCITS